MPSRKPVKPAKLPSSAEEIRHGNTLLERLESEFRAFGDGLKSVRARVDGTFDQTGRNFEAIGRVEDRIGRVEDRLKLVQKDVSELKTGVAELKIDMKEVKGRLATVEAR